MNKFQGKNIGKYFICTLFFIWCVFSNISLYNDIMYDGTWESGTVIAKNETVTSGKYPSQKFIIAFKYDKYGTEDINVSFSTWNSLNPGDRVSFKHYKKNTSLDAFLWCSAVFFDFVIGVLLFGFLIELLIKIWNY